MTKLVRVIALWTALLLASLSPSVSAREAVRGAALAHPALWKVSDHDTTIYLFGTIHALPKGVNWFAGPIASAFNTSDELVTEIAGSDATDVQALTTRIALLPPGQSLRDGLSAGARKALEAARAHTGLAADAYDGFEPWFAAVALSNVPLMKAGYEPSSGV